jgi:membrane dipeptidase
LKAQIFALYVNPVYAPHQALKKGVLLYNTIENRLFSTGKAAKVTSTLEMRSTLEQNKLACWISLESGDIIENSVEILEFFYHLGIRCMTLTHSKNTDWADSSGDKPKHDGLTKLGKDIILKMNELGMVIDVSHSSDKTVEDVLEISSAPIMASHSCARSLCDIPRNLSDDLITEISNKNGYIGVNFFPAFLNKTVFQQMMNNLEIHKGWLNKICKNNEGNPDTINEAEMKLYSKIVKDLDSVDVSSVIDHIEHIIDIGGIDCVGIGSDFDGIPVTPTDLTDVSDYPLLIRGLIDKGFNQQDVAKIMGINLFHFLQRFED